MNHLVFYCLFNIFRFKQAPYQCFEKTRTTAMVYYGCLILLIFQCVIFLFIIMLQWNHGDAGWNYFIIILT
jgi:hypothetical protein